MSESARFAVVLDDGATGEASIRLGRILDFLGVPWQSVESATELAERGLNGSLRGKRCALLASLPAFGKLPTEAAALDGLHSAFVYLPIETQSCAQLLRLVTGDRDLALDEIEADRLDVKVTSARRDLAGPMHGVQCSTRIKTSHRAASVSQTSKISPIISSVAGAHFFSCSSGKRPMFVNCSSAIPDLAEPLDKARYDIKDEFLSAVPLLVYLKWAFRDVCWQPAEAGACWIVDDPVLKTNYGFCDFPKLDAQMKEHGFSTNIAFIPWNWRRTSAGMANLIKQSDGRLSVSIHGCDHTEGEFGNRSAPELESKVTLAKWRMKQHRRRTGILHDPVMVFPQGVFSRASLEVLERHGFTAAVNTELWPVDPEEKPLTRAEAWSAAILRYGGFPLFARRYPRDGVENFAFDLLLGKPCLIVEHHEFFRKKGEQVVRFIQQLNALNCNLRWLSLGEVVKRSFHQRVLPDGTVETRTFAKPDLLDGADASEPVQTGYPVATTARIAARRLLSEFRDNFLSRHESLLLWAGKAKKLLPGSRPERSSFAITD